MNILIILTIISTALAVSIEHNLFASDNACVCDYKQNVDYFPDKVEKNYATTYVYFFYLSLSISHTYSSICRYNVTYFNSYKVLNTVSVTYVLYQCGTPIPDLSATYPGATYVSIPLKRVHVDATPIIPWIEFIGERRSIVSIRQASTISSPCLQKRLDDGDVADVYDSSSWSVNTTMLEELNVDVAFCTGSYGCPLSSNNIISIPVKAQDESSVLAEAEHVEFISLFYNRERAASDVVENIESRFNCSASYVPATPRPKVVWTNYYNGWSAPSCPNYYCELIEAAGGDLITNFPSGSLSYGSLTDSEFLSVAQNADVMLYTGQNYWSADSYGTPSIRVGSGNKSEVLNQIVAVQNELVFDTLGNGPKDWFESRFAEPDLVLQDLINIMHPTALGNTHSNVWFRQIEPQPGIDPIVDSSCPDVNAPLKLKASGPCTALTPVSGVDRVTVAATDSSSVMCDPVTGAPVLCDETCLSCNGPDAMSCQSCESGMELTENGKCIEMSSNNNTSIETGTVVAIAAGVVIALLVIGIIMFFILSSRRNRDEVQVVSAVVVLPTISKN